MIGIITAVTTEKEAVLAEMKEIKTVNVYDIEFYKGVIHNTQCILTMSGVGKVNAARSTQLMIERFGPNKIVNIGSAGALHPDLQVGDVIISTLCVQHDVDLTAFGLKKGTFGDNDEGFVQTDAEFAELCKEAMERSTSSEFKVYSGPIATGDQFNDSIEKKNELFEEFGAFCNEMEGAAVAQVCSSCKVPFVVIRSISDSPEKNSPTMYERFKKLAAERCAKFLIELIEILEEKEAQLCPVQLAINFKNSEG